ncbi:glycoside hydrolase family 128 protein, partial [Lophiostoma macrostomum CBS 122681]
TALSSSKRGLIHIPSSIHPGDDFIWTNHPTSELSWYYNYKSMPSKPYEENPSLQFVPMLWGSFPSNFDDNPRLTFMREVEHLILAGHNISHVLGFNEPDGEWSTGGSNISPKRAAETWVREIEPLKDWGIKLGAPAVTGSPRGFAWLEEWFRELDDNGVALGRGCNPDFMPVHFYGNFESLASHIGQMMATYPNMTVWVTEWGYPNQTLDDTQWFFSTTTNWFDSLESVTHYSYFGAFRSDVSNVGPYSAMLTEKGKLTDIGSWYLGGEATNNIPQ